MKWTRACAAIVGLLVLVVGWAILQAWPRPAPVYSLAQVVAGLMSHPQQWAERTVVVRGTVLDVRQLLPRGPAETAPLRVIITPPMPPQNPQATAVGDRMLYAQSVARGTALMLLTQPPNVVVALLRRVLLLGDLLPPPQRGSTFGSGLYRIRLAPAGRSCVRLRPLLRRLLHAPKRRLRVLQSRPLRDCYDGIFADYLP